MHKAPSVEERLREAEEAERGWAWGLGTLVLWGGGSTVRGNLEPGQVAVCTPGCWPQAPWSPGVAIPLLLQISVSCL